MNNPEGALISVAALLAVLLVSVRTRKRKVLGFGMVLQWVPEKGGVVVVSRLTNSPAGWAGVKIGTLVHSANGTRLDSFEAFKRWSVEAHPVEGKEEAYIFYGEEGAKEVRMRPIFVRKDIPVYPPLPKDDSGLTKQRMMYCKLTDQHYFRRKITLEAIRNAYF